MKALTIWQPWATLIMLGAKPYEFRSWPVPFSIWQSRIVIHAGARPVRRQELAALMNRQEWVTPDAPTKAIGEALDLLDRWWSTGEGLPMAAGLGTALLGEPRRATDLFPDSDRIDEHKWGWPVSEIEGWMPPRPCRGFQGFWTWPRDLGAAA